MKRCDRCVSVVDETWNDRGVWHCRLFLLEEKKVPDHYEKENCSTYWELCDRCLASFQRWMQRGE